MALSATEIRDRAANLLGILPFGQSLQSQDAARIEQGYAEVYERLKQEECAFWAYASDVPDKYCEWVIAMTAANCMDDYGVSAERYARVAAKASEAVTMIIKMGSEPYVNNDLITDF